jgi:hypothetical protein
VPVIVACRTGLTVTVILFATPTQPLADGVTLYTIVPGSFPVAVSV